MLYITIIIAIILLGIYYRLGRIADKRYDKPFTPYPDVAPVPEGWDGPEPTLEQRQETWQWMVEYFKRYPNSDIKNEYPQLYQIAMASKRYDELELLRDAGKIDEIDYGLELEKILPLLALNDLP